MVKRKASHAGSWYTDNGPSLSRELDGWLSNVPDNIDGIGTIPKQGARLIIAPWVLQLIGISYNSSVI